MLNHQNVLKMKEVRKCKYCGKEFVPRSGMQKYCCEECQTKAKEARKKRQMDFMNAVEPVIDLQCQEYLTFAKAAILMGCSRQYIYKLVNEGKLAASRISSRMAFIRKADIEKMLAGNPYHRVLPTNRPKKAKEPVTKSAKAIDMGREPGSSFSEDSLKAAADALMDMVECSAERATVAMEGLLDVIQDIAWPETHPSFWAGHCLMNRRQGKAEFRAGRCLG